jgi:hypothetical protein
MQQRGRYHTAGTATGGPSALFGRCLASADGRYHSGREPRRRHSCSGSLTDDKSVRAVLASRNVVLPIPQHTTNSRASSFGANLTSPPTNSRKVERVSRTFVSDPSVPLCRPLRGGRSASEGRGAQRGAGRRGPPDGMRGHRPRRRNVARLAAVAPSINPLRVRPLTAQSIVSNGRCRSDPVPAGDFPTGRSSGLRTYRRRSCRRRSG